jgi:hypothetical protein
MHVYMYADAKCTAFTNPYTYTRTSKAVATSFEGMKSQYQVQKFIMVRYVRSSLYKYSSQQNTGCFTHK